MFKKYGMIIYIIIISRCLEFTMFKMELKCYWAWTWFCCFFRKELLLYNTYIYIIYNHNITQDDTWDCKKPAPSWSWRWFVTEPSVSNSSDFPNGNSLMLGFRGQKCMFSLPSLCWSKNSPSILSIAPPWQTSQLGRCSAALQVRLVSNAAAEFSAFLISSNETVWLHGCCPMKRPGFS